ncbi:MAG TPA: hypothetical protein VF389_11800 [Woeseiaceae bacterium]
MADLSRRARNSVSLQSEMFRLAERDHGLSIKVLLAGNKHLKDSTLRGWASGATAMPAYGVGELRRAGMPVHLLGFILDPFDLGFVEGSPVDEAYDELALEASGFVQDYLERKADGRLCHQDKAALDERKRRLAAAANKAGTA